RSLFPRPPGRAPRAPRGAAGAPGPKGRRPAPRPSSKRTFDDGLRRSMIATLLVVLFVGLMLAGVPVSVALGLGGVAPTVAPTAAPPWWGLLAAPQNMHASIAKYPLLALPMFVLVGSIFDRSGVARRMVTFAEACVGRAPGTLPMVAILVAMVLGGISGSGPANAAAVGGVMIAAMARAGYPHPFSASLVGA